MKKLTTEQMLVEVVKGFSGFYYSGENDDEVKDMVKQILNAHVQEWISIEDRLPKPSTRARYLVIDKHNLYRIEGFSNSKGWDYLNQEVLKPTHWMPLPVPPKEGE